MDNAGSKNGALFQTKLVGATHSKEGYTEERHMFQKVAQLDATSSTHSSVSFCGGGATLAMIQVKKKTDRCPSLCAENFALCPSGVTHLCSLCLRGRTTHFQASWDTPFCSLCLRRGVTPSRPALNTLMESSRSASAYLTLCGCHATHRTHPSRLQHTTDLRTRTLPC